MSDDPPVKNHNTLWATVGKIAAPFIGGVIAAAFWFGVRTQKNASNIEDVLVWKKAVEPQIQRMDSRGTAAGERFSLEQGKELGRMEEQLKELEKEAKSIEAMKLKIDTLERATFARVPDKR